MRLLSLLQRSTQNETLRAEAAHQSIVVESQPQRQRDRLEQQRHVGDQQHATETTIESCVDRSDG